MLSHGTLKVEFCSQSGTQVESPKREHPTASLQPFAPFATSALQSRMKHCDCPAATAHNGLPRLAAEAQDDGDSSSQAIAHRAAAPPGASQTHPWRALQLAWVDTALHVSTHSS